MDNMTKLSDGTLEQATLHAGIGATAQSRLFNAVARAMNGETVTLPTNMKNKLTADLYNTYKNLPLAEHLHARLIDGHSLNRFLAERLLEVKELDHRTFLAPAAQNLREHQATIEDTIRCEDLLALVEAIFLWLCASKGKTIDVAVSDLPVDLDAIEAARKSFGHSGHYRGDTAIARHERFHRQLDTTSRTTLARSVLSLHESVCEERGRAPWIWEDQGVLFSDVDVERPTEDELQVGLAWRNDYYLKPLRNIAEQLSEVRQ
jgi:hypothetical protein